MDMHQIHRRKQRILGKNLVVRRIAEVMPLDDVAPIQAAPRLLPVHIRHPVAIKIIGQPELIQIDGFIPHGQIRALRPVLRHKAVIINHQLRARPLRCGHRVRQHRRLNRVVRIDKRDILAPRDVQPRVSRRGKTAVRLVHLTDARVLRGVFRHDSRAVVLRAVIHQNQLKILEGLRKDAVKAPRQIRLHLIDRYDHTDAAHSFSSTPARYRAIIP